MQQKKILIVGAGSYVGENFKRWIEKDGAFSVDELDVKANGFTGFDFSPYHSIVFVAGIVHKKKNEISYEEYLEVNAVLPLKIAQLSKSQGVGLFVFISTMAVYGQGKKLPNGFVVTEHTPLNAKCAYGKSKLAGETMVRELASESFSVAIVRPPNIYGVNCPGNYIKGFVRIASLLPIFPLAFLASKQSLLFIDNLSELLRLIILAKKGGNYCPQDQNPISTTELLKIIAETKRYSLGFSKNLGRFTYLFQWHPLVLKVLGGISYDQTLSSHFEGKYQLFSTEQGLQKTLSATKQPG